VCCERERGLWIWARRSHLFSSEMLCESCSTRRKEIEKVLEVVGGRKERRKIVGVVREAKKKIGMLTWR
jgi:hypothetical protein